VDARHKAGHDEVGFRREFAVSQTRTRKFTELIHEGKFAAEVVVDLRYDDESWSPTMSIDDARKLEAVHIALREGDLATAAKYGRVFKLLPISA
jgi:hypothetical protein